MRVVGVVSENAQVSKLKMRLARIVWPRACVEVSKDTTRMT